tara:strand:+ start:728 stop:838 length:111 start_codon:yes stop_codon:yes gene_type:complete
MLMVLKYVKDKLKPVAKRKLHPDIHVRKEDELKTMV